MILLLLSNSEYKVPTIIPNQNNHSLYGENYKKLMKSIKWNLNVKVYHIHVKTQYYKTVNTT